MFHADSILDVRNLIKLLPLLMQYKGIEREVDTLFSRMFALIFNNEISVQKEVIECFDKVYLRKPETQIKEEVSPDLYRANRLLNLVQNSTVAELESL